MRACVHLLPTPSIGPVISDPFPISLYLAVPCSGLAVCDTGNTDHQIWRHDPSDYSCTVHLLISGAQYRPRATECAMNGSCARPQTYGFPCVDVLAGMTGELDFVFCTRGLDRVGKCVLQTRELAPAERDLAASRTRRYSRARITDLFLLPPFTPPFGRHRWLSAPHPNAATAFWISPYNGSLAIPERCRPVHLLMRSDESSKTP